MRAVEEVCLNVIEHAFEPGQLADLDIVLLRGPGQLVVAVEDRGLPFDWKTLEARPHSSLTVPSLTGLADAVRFSNLGMTGLTGWDVAERIRASDPLVPVVFITGWGLQAEDRDRCRKLGVINVLFKPVRPAELHMAVQEALAASTRHQPG